jgi:hypothetical protein
MKRPSGQSDEYEIALVTAFFEGKGFRVERIEHSRKHGKSPDLRVLSDAGPVALCEVKAPNDEVGDNHFEGMSPGEIRELGRSDPTFNRLSRNIEKAHGQLVKYDPDHLLLRFIAFVNYDEGANIGDLRLTLTGEELTEDGPIAVMKNISEGRLGTIKHQIDAFLWFRAWDRGFEGGMLTANRERNERARHLLGFSSKG